MSIDTVKGVLGNGRSKLSIVSSIFFVLLTVFYVYTIGSYIGTTIYVFQNRVTYVRFFIDVYIINEYLDHLIISTSLIFWLALNIRGMAAFVICGFYIMLVLVSVTANLGVLLDISAITSFPVMMLTLLVRRAGFVTQKKIFTSINTNTFVTYLGIFAIGSGIVSIVVSVAPVFSISVPIRNYAYEVYVLLSSSLSSTLMVLLLLSLPLKLLIVQFLDKMKKPRRMLTVNLFIDANSIKKSKKVILYLVLFMFLSVALVLIPHQQSINKENQQIGADTHYYVEWINALNQTRNMEEFLQQAFVVQSGGDRPLSLLFLFSIMKITDIHLFYLVEYSPVILGPALIAVIYFLTRELVSNESISLLAAFLTAVSFQVLIGIYTGFYANWLAVIIGYLSIIFLFKFLKTSTKVNIAMYSVSLCLLLFAHIYTWSIFVIVIAAFLLIILKLRYYPRRIVLLLFLPLVATVVIDIVRVSITGSYSGILQDIDAATRLNIGPGQFTSRWNNLGEAIHIYYAGLFANFIILALGLYWVYRADLKELSTIFLIIFFSIGSLTLFFGDWQLQNRVRYDIPFQIPAAIALFQIGKERDNTNIILLATVLWLLGLSIRAVSNFYLI